MCVKSTPWRAVGAAGRFGTAGEGGQSFVSFQRGEQAFESLGAALEWHNTTLPAGAPAVGAA